MVGYFAPRLLGISHFQAKACAFEIGIHNDTLALTIALTVMSSPMVAMPAAIYSILMYIRAAMFGMVLRRLEHQQDIQVPVVNS